MSESGGDSEEEENLALIGLGNRKKAGKGKGKVVGITDRLPKSKLPGLATGKKVPIYKCLE